MTVRPGNQTWNRYAYVTNNPLSFIDPTGRNQDNTCASADDPCDGEGGGGGAGGDTLPSFGGGLFGGFCDASCGAGGFGSGVGVNGVPWNFGPGYFTSTISGTANIMAGQARYLSIINTGWDPALGINWNNVESAKYSFSGLDNSSIQEKQKERDARSGYSMPSRAASPPPPLRISPAPGGVAFSPQCV